MELVSSEGSHAPMSGTWDGKAPAAVGWGRAECLGFLGLLYCSPSLSPSDLLSSSSSIISIAELSSHTASGKLDFLHMSSELPGTCPKIEARRSCGTFFLI